MNLPTSTFELTMKDLAKPGCRKCNGTGITGYKTEMPPGEINTDKAVRKPIACGCAVKTAGKLRKEIERQQANDKLRALVKQVQMPWWKRCWFVPLAKLWSWLGSALRKAKVSA